MIKRRCTESCPAFTLIELLTTLGILVVLAALLFAAVRKTLDSAKEAEGVANLRQIGSAVHLYAISNNDMLPYAYYEDNYHFSLALSGYLANTGTTYASNTSENAISPIFADPIAKIRKAESHYSAHPRLMPSVSKNSASTTPQTRLSTISRPSKLILLADGCQDKNTGSVSATLSSVDRIKTRYAEFVGNPDTAVPTGPNTDEKSSSGNIRWRMQKDRAAKFLFVDGHVKVLHQGDLKYANILAD